MLLNNVRGKMTLVPMLEEAVSSCSRSPHLFKGLPKHTICDSGLLHLRHICTSEIANRGPENATFELPVLPQTFTIPSDKSKTYIVPSNISASAPLVCSTSMLFRHVSLLVLSQYRMKLTSIPFWPHQSRHFGSVAYLSCQST